MARPPKLHSLYKEDAEEAPFGPWLKASALVMHTPKKQVINLTARKAPLSIKKKKEPVSSLKNVVR
jgi:hypothetical protein